jgi:hypothetical protein
MVSAKAFWKQAELISPGRPWVAAARELGVNPAIVQDASRKPVAAQCQSSRNGALRHPTSQSSLKALRHILISVYCFLAPLPGSFLSTICVR